MRSNVKFNFGLSPNGILFRDVNEEYLQKVIFEQILDRPDDFASAVSNSFSCDDPDLLIKIPKKLMLMQSIDELRKYVIVDYCTMSSTLIVSNGDLWYEVWLLVDVKKLLADVE